MYALPEINLIPKEKTVLDLPEDLMKNRMVLLCLIGALAWDYAFTVLDLAAQMKLRELSKASRAIRQLKEEYKTVLLCKLSHKDIDALTSLGLQFESVCGEHLSKLSLSLQNEKEIRECREDYRYLVVAVQMAMTVIDAMRLYAADFDAFLYSQGVHGKSVELAQIGKAAIILPQYAGDAYNPQSPSRKLTAKILYNELKLYEHNGIESDRANDA